MTPSYPAVLSPTSHRVRFEITPTGRQKSNLIYRIYDASTGESYIGKTMQLFNKRMKQHESQVNTGAGTHLHEAIHSRPHDFSLFIAHEADPSEDLDDCERRLIEEFDSVSHGYNLRSGGGGGSGSSEAHEEEDCTPPQTTTPTKYYPLRKDRKKRVSIDWTPDGKNLQGVYVIKNQETNERYVGKTERPFRRRMSEHLSSARHPETKRGQLPFYQAIRENPEDFAFGILSEKTSSAIERYFIQLKNSQNHGFNANGGGGGGHAKRSLSMTDITLSTS